MIYSQKPGGAAYADRAERAERPPMDSVQVATSSTPFNKLRARWNELTAEEQEKAVESGNYEPGAAN